MFRQRVNIGAAAMDSTKVIMCFLTIKQVNVFLVVVITSHKFLFPVSRLFF